MKTLYQVIMEIRSSGKLVVMNSFDRPKLAINSLEFYKVHLVDLIQDEIIKLYLDTKTMEG
ncbi:hypothetical protein [Candidatus Formimonas warabiya]|uniref:Uncharacterized protein n=1 Tax=Formimonas warabiya TaxID=1761012 RepID=A0A3G1KPA5_FORW1|nr:hypothetical protein [Candidatus Formimonas warabiya]ATW24266.1 hypothetical protein DCMF_05215 [Candidatus Formimonas warabiya]